MKTIKTKVFASLDKEYMWDVGDRLGLSEEAKNYLMYFNEIPIEIEIDKETGEVVGYEAKNEIQLSIHSPTTPNS